jgi:uncharacterized membrane protein YphA (DoxX/SURF4 family)
MMIFATTILGLTESTFTAVHVLLSVVGIASGLLVVYGLLTRKRFDGATALFLVTTVLTSVTGFLFHSYSSCPRMWSASYR